MTNIYLTAILFVFLLMFSNDAHAYINPGTGSDFVQMLVGIILAITNFFKKIGNKVKQICSFNKKYDKK